MLYLFIVIVSSQLIIQLFTRIPNSGVPKSGIHAIDTRDLIGSTEWRNPSLVMGYYGGLPSFWEPMYPLVDAVNFVNSDITYVDQTVPSLPSYYSFDYDPTTGVIVQVMKGMAEMCPDDLGSGKEGGGSSEGEMDPPEGDDTTSSATAVAASYIIGSVLTGLSVMTS